jgi:hypothetical protein
MRNNQLQSSAKNVQAREAAPKQKKATVPVADANDENVDPTRASQPNRRSSRLHGNASDAKAKAPRANQRGGRKPQHHSSPSPPVDDTGSGAGRRRPVTSTRGKSTTFANLAIARPSRETSPTYSPTTADGNHQSQLGDFDEIQGLRRQLQEEKGHSSYQTLLRIRGLTNFQTRTGCCVALPSQRPHRFQRQFQSPKDLSGRPVSVSSRR